MSFIRLFGGYLYAAALAVVSFVYDLFSSFCHFLQRCFAGSMKTPYSDIAPQGSENFTQQVYIDVADASHGSQEQVMTDKQTVPHMPLGHRASRPKLIIYAHGLFGHASQFSYLHSFFASKQDVIFIPMSFDHGNSLQTDVDTLVSVYGKVSQAYDVVLVGHSRGALVIYNSLLKLNQVCSNPTAVVTISAPWKGANLLSVCEGYYDFCQQNVAMSCMATLIDKTVETCALTHARLDLQKPDINREVLGFPWFNAMTEYDSTVGTEGQQCLDSHDNRTNIFTQKSYSSSHLSILLNRSLCKDVSEFVSRAS